MQASRHQWLFQDGVRVRMLAEMKRTLDGSWLDADAYPASTPPDPDAGGRQHEKSSEYGSDRQPSLVCPYALSGSLNFHELS